MKSGFNPGAAHKVHGTRYKIKGTMVLSTKCKNKIEDLRYKAKGTKILGAKCKGRYKLQETRVLSKKYKTRYKVQGTSYQDTSCKVQKQGIWYQGQVGYNVPCNKIQGTM